MHFPKSVPLMTTMLIGSMVMSFAASASVSVTNQDAKAHVIVIEDYNEDIAEVPIDVGQTLENLCQEGCFIWLKEVDDAQFVAAGTKARMLIQNSQLAPAP